MMPPPQNWVAKDVCDVLGHSDVSMAVQRLDDDEKLIQAMYGTGVEQVQDSTFEQVDKLVDISTQISGETEEPQA